MEEENIKIKITYNNEEHYKNIFMDYIIKFILNNGERSFIEEKDGERK